MSLDFRDVSAGLIRSLTVSAPAGCIIGVVGGKNSGVTDLLKLAGGALAPASGEIRASEGRRYVAPGDPLNLAPVSVVALDQSLATQDAVVRGRTLPALDRLRRSGSIILIASHEDRLLETFCDEVWWLEAGELASKGDPKETMTRYRRFVADQLRQWGETVPPRMNPSSRSGDQRAEVVSLETLGANGQPTLVWKSGEYVSVRAMVRFLDSVADPVIGMLLRTQIGFEVYGTNTEQERVTIGPQKAEDSITVTFQFLCDLCPQAYTISLYSQDHDGTIHDWAEDAVAVTVTDERNTSGVANLRAKVTVIAAAQQ
jgi:energy-coupling factor transporter ATP-binding protein EcfA2